MGVSPSTVCRELARSRKPSGKYHAIYARLQAKARRVAANQHLRKLLGNTRLEALVTSKLCLQWSPEQTSGWLRRRGVATRVCAQTIYDWLSCHWEGGTVVGYQNLARIGTLVERKSGYLRAFLLPDGTCGNFARGAATALQPVPEKYLRTLTLDNGQEMQSYEFLERLTPLRVFFAYPCHSWERGTNGLLRQYFQRKQAWLYAKRSLT